MCLRYSQDILQSKVLIFILELSDILDRENHFPSPNESAKYQRLFADFLRMLPEHIRREHTVTFYAGLLNITRNTSAASSGDCLGAVLIRLSATI